MTIGAKLDKLGMRVPDTCPVYLEDVRVPVSNLLGEVEIVFDPADGNVRHRAEAAFGEVFDTAIELGGTITGEHGVGAAKRPYLQRRLGADQMALLRRLKSAFDPAGILNPGKLGS